LRLYGIAVAVAVTVAVANNGQQVFGQFMIDCLQS
jgi:hypothetical protein